jgi:hypothetical protein
MRKILSLLFSLSIVKFSIACPGTQQLILLLEKVIPVKKIYSIEPLSHPKGFCRVEATVKVGSLSKNYTLFVSDDGRYLFPFVGKLVRLDTPFGKNRNNVQTVGVKSLRHPGRIYLLGTVYRDGNDVYFLPVVFDLKEGKPVEISDFVPQPAR